MPIVIHADDGGVVSSNVGRSSGAPKPKREINWNPGNLTMLVVGVVAMILLSKLNLGEMGHGREAPKPVEGYELVSNSPPFGMVTVRGMVQYVKKSSTRGLILEVRAEDGTPFTAWVGPDISVPNLKGRDRLALVGKLQTDLFVVSEVTLERQLSERITYYVAHTKNGWAYVQDGNNIKKFPLPVNFNGETITVSYFGKRIVVEAE